MCSHRRPEQVELVSRRRTRYTLSERPARNSIPGLPHLRFLPLLSGTAGKPAGPTTRLQKGPSRMRRLLSVLALGLLCAGPARAQGLLVPTETDVSPLAMRSHEVTVTIEDQVA